MVYRDQRENEKYDIAGMMSLVYRAILQIFHQEESPGSLHKHFCLRNPIPNTIYDLCIYTIFVFLGTGGKLNTVFSVFICGL